MTRSVVPVRRVAGARVLLAIAILVAALPPAAAVRAAEATLDAAASTPAASPAPASPLTIETVPLLAGNVRPGAWAAVRVRLRNDGPAITGELRIATFQPGASTYGIEVQLATGARQEHILYGQTGFFGGRFLVSLVRDDSVIASQNVVTTALDPGAMGVAIVAERPDRLIGPIRESIAGRQAQRVEVDAVAPEDLPARVEAWAALDRIVWQDVSADRLTPEQVDALRTWVALGGELVILGGSTGVGGVDAFPADLLPYPPTHLVDVPLGDLADLLGTLPEDATPVPAIAGPVGHGVTLGWIGEEAIAARAAVGLGSVTLLGIDPLVPWLDGTALAADLWVRLLPATANLSDPGGRFDGEDGDRGLVNALGYLPSIQSARMDHLFLLFIAYVVLLGPINYLVLKRLDRREWAWITMPALVIVFTAAAFLFGVVLKGTSMVVNELGVVQGAADSDRGMATLHVGIFSPTRDTFDVRVHGGALVSETASDQDPENGASLDVLLGDPSRLRRLQVGSGGLRAFRAEGAVTTPRLETDMRLVDARLQGTLTNASGAALDHVSVAYGGGIQVLGAMAVGESRPIDVGPGGQRGSVVRRMFGTDPATGGATAGRVAVLRWLSGDAWWDEGQGSTLLDSGPLVLAWRSGATLDLDPGVATERVGDVLYLLPIRAAIQGPVTFTGSTVRRSVLAVDAVDSWMDGTGLYLDRGTMIASYRPAALDRDFDVTGLTIRLDRDRRMPASADGDDLVPLPEAEQPDQDDPVGSALVDPPAFAERLPRLQLMDRVSRRWVEFPPLTTATSYRIADPWRYVDGSGALLVRFVSRTTPDSAFYTDILLEGRVP